MIGGVTFEARAKSVFLEALEAGAGDRAAVLDRVCAGDEALRARVGDLLAAHGDDPLDPGAEVGPAPARVPDRIGRYRPARVIALGGMGVVYEARQDRPSRAVALKVLHSPAPSAAAQRRFEHEAEILARLHHPGIAQVYEVGTTDGACPVPFVSMELVPDALPLTGFADRRGLALRARVELVVQVCEAVHHAHQRGVIHRDLKPANLLVGCDGRVKVIDFGVARLCGAEDAATLLTMPGQLVGTLRYMSPEQGDGDGRDVDVRADVYAIGVVLYELVCGRPPHELAGLSVVASLRRMRETPPIAPRVARPGLPRDLEAVILKALRSRREERYRSAADMADDLRRHLAGDPVEARPPGVAARAWRRMGRHPIAATSCVCAVIVAASLAGTLLGVMLLALRPDRVVTVGVREGAALLSRAGHRLAAWDAGHEGSVILRELVDGPNGSARLVLLGFDHRASGTGFPGEIVAFEAWNPTTPVWRSGATPLHPPGDYGSRPEAVGTLDAAVTADVFPEVPGVEVIAAHSMYPYSASCLRVYDLRGRVRYSVWHDGAVGTVHWMSNARRLIVTGLNSEHRWDERGFDLARGRYPVVVFALDPRDGHADPGWIVNAGRRSDDTLAWYRWLGPAELLAPLRDVYAIVGPPESGWDPARHALVQFSAGWPAGDGRRAGFVFLLDASGRVASRWDDDGYKARLARGEVAPIADLRLLDYESLPPAGAE